MIRKFSILAMSLLLTWSGAAPVRAEVVAERAQVSAATVDAQKALRADILATRINPKLTVRQFLEKTNALDLLDEMIQQSQQIGAPRWIDDQTCQVKLELSGARVARSLNAIAATRAQLSPIPAGVLEETLSDWKTRAFVATGASVSAQRAQGIRPIESNARWRLISDDARRDAIIAARSNADQNVVDSIRPIQLGDGQTVGDLLQREPVRIAVQQWLKSQPVTQFRFSDDMNVELTVATPAEQLLQVVIDSCKNTPELQTRVNEQNIEELEREFNRRVSAAIGRAAVAAPEAPGTQRSTAIKLPAQPPTWVGLPLDADGISPRATTVLRAKTAAEDNATANLQSRISSLALSRTTTLGEAARQDQRLADAIARTLLRARVYRVDYNQDGSVHVRMTIDSADLWRELQEVAAN